MYRVMIVDDEPLILAGIASLLDWEAQNLKIVGKAANGKAALEQIEELRPDIVITDIKMPAMDGITLMKECMQREYGSAFILLTNLEEFDLVREALHYGAVDYLIKLELNEESLKNSLEKAIERCEKNRREGVGCYGEGSSIAEQIRKYFRSILIYDMPVELEESLKKEIAGRFRKPALILINFNYGNVEFSELFTREDQKKSMGFAENIIGEMVRGFFRENCLLSRGQNGFMLVVSTAGIENYQEQIQTMGKKLQSVMRDYFEIAVTIAASVRGEQISELQELLYQAMSAMNFSFYEGNEAIVIYSSVCEETDRHSDNFNISFLKKDLMFAVRQNDEEQFTRIMNQVIELFREYRPSRIQAVNACNHLYYFIVSQLEERETEAFPYAVDIIGQLNRLENLDMVLHWLTGFRDAVQNALRLYREQKHDKYVELAKQYVQHHYKEKISLNQVAAELYVSVGHLSKSFKQQTGINFSEYVAEIKVEKAKELIETRKYMVYEIADMLGYETPFYFSRVFKKVVGVSPREYELMVGGK